MIAYGRFFIVLMLFSSLSILSYGHDHRTNCPSTIDVQLNVPAGFERYYVPTDVLDSVRQALVSDGQLICRYNNPTAHIRWNLRSAVSLCRDSGMHQYTCEDQQNIHPTVTVTCSLTIPERATNLPSGWRAHGNFHPPLSQSGANTSTANDVVYCHFNAGNTPSIEIRKSVPSRHTCTSRANGFDCRTTR